MAEKKAKKSTKKTESKGKTMDVKPPKDFKKNAKIEEQAEIEQAALAEATDEELEEIIADADQILDSVNDDTNEIDEATEATETAEEPVEKTEETEKIAVKIEKDAPEEEDLGETEEAEEEISDETEETPEEDLSENKNETPEETEDKLKAYEEEIKPFTEMKKDKKKNHKALRIISRILAILSAITAGLFIYRLSTTSVLPAKYFYPILGGLAFLELLYLIFAFKKHTKKVTLIIWDILMVIVSVVLGFAALKVNEIFSFLDKNIENKQYAVYDVIVKKDSGYSELSDLKNKELKTYEELIKDVSDEKLEAAVKEKIEGSTVKYISDIDELMNAIAENKEDAMVINNGTYESYTENFTEYSGKVKIIATIEIEMDEKAVEATNHDLTNTPFILYISGIDTRTGTMPTRSLSDVNIIAVVNPKSKHVQLISIPRDSYVQLHGTEGLRDKLTHAGSRGGVALSQATLEDLYGVSIDRYVRVNFNFVEQLVDAVGGITINSSVDYSFVTHHEKCTINPGENFLNGKCAIGFSRERYAYKDGDRQRGRNQLQVIEKLIEKATSGTTILSKYSQILDSLNGTFDSNLSMDDITSLVRMQLDDMAKWKVEDYSITGTGAKATTYSYPNQNLYVMYIDEASLQTAKDKIKSVLSE